MTAEERTDMRDTSRPFHNAFIASLFLLLACIGTRAQAQEGITIQADAWGTSTQLGKIFPVKISIDQLSTDEDRKVLIDAFTRSGQEGMVNALGSMSPKGRISLEGSTGNPVRYIRELPSNEGRRFRLVNDREIFMGEMTFGARATSSQYSIGAVELTITPDGKGSGVLLPACKLKVNKEKQIEIESYQNSWQLKNLIVTFGK